jgi:FAD/FMN-containing dehydrogenase
MRSPFSAIHIHHLEGAVTRVPPADMAFAHRDARFVLNIVGLWMSPDSATHVGWVRDLWQAIQPSATGAVYLNFLGEEGRDRVHAAYGADKYARLAELKKKYDPANFFRINQNILPA